MQSVINFFQKLIKLLCVFFYLYSVQLVGIPFGTRILLAMGGICVLIFTVARQAKEKRDILLDKGLILYAGAFIAIITISVIAIFINGTSDYEFIEYPFSLVLILLAGYFLHFIFKKSQPLLQYETIMKYIVAAVFVQVILSLMAFLSPAISDLLFKIQSFSELDISKLEETAEFRLNGFGSTFFGAGIINGFALLVIAVLLGNKTNSRIKTVTLAFAFLVIFVLGMMMARTTIIGFILAILYMLFPALGLNKRVIKNKFRFFSAFIIIPVIGFLAISVVSPSTKDLLTNAASFGFEMFINYSENGQLESQSTDALKTMYVFPKSTKTYIIGDGKYYYKPGDPSSTYYMGTDVGYLRLIYYFGIFGTISYFILQYTAVQNAINRNKGNKYLARFLLFTFLYCLILNLKGFTDLFFLTTLFCFPFSQNNNALN